METISKSGAAAIIEISGANHGLNHKVQGRLQELAGKSLTFVCDEEVATSSTVRLQTSDLLVLGEVLRSEPETDQQTWTVYVKVTRKLAIL